MTASRSTIPGGSEDLRNIIAQKERELHDINEFRQVSLESILADKVGRPNHTCAVLVTV